MKAGHVGSGGQIDLNLALMSGLVIIHRQPLAHVGGGIADNRILVRIVSWVEAKQLGAQGSFFQRLHIVGVEERILNHVAQKPGRALTALEGRVLKNAPQLLSDCILLFRASCLTTVYRSRCHKPYVHPSLHGVDSAGPLHRIMNRCRARWCSKVPFSFRGPRQANFACWGGSKRHPAHSRTPYLNA